MGYFVEGNGVITMPHDNEDKAYQALCDLNKKDHLKRGGSWGGELNSESPRPSGLDYHPARWFSWMDPNYPAKCKNWKQIMEMVGFEFSGDHQTTMRDGRKATVYYLNYDNKTGQEELFLNALSPFAEGSIDWRGEDGDMWRDILGEESMKVQPLKPAPSGWATPFVER